MITKFFRTSQLWQGLIDRLNANIQAALPAVRQLTMEICFYVDSSRELRDDEKVKLEWLLRETFEPDSFNYLSQLVEEFVLEFGTRISRVTPASTNAVAICHACGLDSITRLEQARRYRVKLYSGQQLTPEQEKLLKQLLHDQMTEQYYPKTLNTLTVGDKPEPVQLIPVLERGLEAIRQANQELGLAIDDQLGEYIVSYAREKLHRNLTDVELFMFGQLNSQHCRHHLFRGQFIIDGVVQPYSLFDMIRETTTKNSGNSKVAYIDNAAAFGLVPVKAFVSSNPTTASPYIIDSRQYCIIFKIETHNHPTAFEAFQGAATGTGGDIRDRFGLGRGSIPVAGLACYYVGNLFIPGQVMLWEKEYALHPKGFQTPLEILIQASNGASDYGNKFGQPLILGSVTSFEQIVDGEHYAWRKPCMVAGGCGVVDLRHIHKQQLEPGQLLVQIGGDAYRIGLGGGSGSSKEAGTQDTELDFNSVQRADPEMENRELEVFRACSELGDNNPIVTVTDLGAGGESVALPEISHPAGARVYLRKIPCGDSTMPVYVIWCNESQERMVMVIRPEGLPILQKICERNRCPIAVIGEITGDGKFTLIDEQASVTAPVEQQKPIDLGMDFLLADLPRATINCTRQVRQLQPFKLPASDGTIFTEVELEAIIRRVLTLLKVGSKHFLTRKVDRSVGGLVAQQQTVGPLQLPLADCAVVAHSYWSKTGTVQSIGEQPIKGLIDPAAGARLSIGEALTNMVWALVESFESINFSATWQWPCGQPGEDAKLYDAVKAATDQCLRQLQRIPVGKDSVSMTAWTTRNGEKHAIKAPGTVQIVACAPTPDITKKVTPDIKRPGETKLMFIDLASGFKRLGGSALAQVYNQLGNESPDITSSELLVSAFKAVQELVAEGLILAGHDRSDGGLITSVLEMAFAGNCGLDIDLRTSDIWGDDVLASLFTEELGLIFEYLPKDEEGVAGILNQHGLKDNHHLLGTTSKSQHIRIELPRGIFLNMDMLELRDVWQSISFALDEFQANPGCVAAERKNIYCRQGLNFNLSFELHPTDARLMSAEKKFRVAVLREEGTNGHRELAGAFTAAGFEAWDVSMHDLATGKISLDQFRGLAWPGGFSFGDVLDSGKGWAGVVKFNNRLREEFTAFMRRSDTFSLGVCNGCQLMALLGIVPWSGISEVEQPRFVRNESTIFESRFVSLRILPNPAIFFKGMEESVLGIWVAHGEGRCYWPNREILTKVLEGGMAPLRYVDDEGQVTNKYPFNPNGSEYGIAALCTPDGRHLALMPHPERLFLPWQWPFWPSEWAKLKATPWLKIFQNAREWCEQKK